MRQTVPNSRLSSPSPNSILERTIKTSLASGRSISEVPHNLNKALNLTLMSKDLVN